jgi:hypothetical protein
MALVPFMRRVLRILILLPETPSFPQTTTKKASNPMAEPSSPITFENVPLDEARKMSRGPRMDPEIYHTL